MATRTLRPADLYRPTDPASLGFETTAEVADLEGIVGQDRAVAAVEFSIGLRHQGYNVFALGPEGSGRLTLLGQAIRSHAATEQTPSDWCYVHNFVDPQKPLAIRLPPGRSSSLREDMARLTTELRSAIPAAFEDERFRQRREALEAELKERRERAFVELEGRATQEGLGLIRTPVGIGLAPVRNGKILETSEFEHLEPAEQARLKVALEKFEGELEATLREVPRWERDLRRKVRDLVTETVRSAVGHLIEELRPAYADVPAVGAYLDAVEIDVIENADDFLAAAAQAPAVQAVPFRSLALETPALRRYLVNVIVDHSATRGAPVVQEDHPTQANLIGRVEYLAQMGALVTDYTMIKAGALHRANGGYLVLDARRVLTQPYAWESLKRVLQSRELRIESVGQSLGLISTVSLEPEAIPLDVKVALYGDRELYYLLGALDPEFRELFKIQADFDERVDRTPETDTRFAQLIATLARREATRPLEAPAVARLLEHASRLAEDSDKLATNWARITDLLREADFYAGDGRRQTLGVGEIDAAIDARIRRASRVRERVHEEILRGTLLIATDGEEIGQVNGLTVMQLADAAFGWPTRITARVRLGVGEVVDIEREVDLGGPIHSKGVLILAGFIGGRFSGDRPLPLRASLVFEQSYGMVEGDSASLGELCALLSSLAGIPLRQALAITGSVNQLGMVQPIGGVNDKIEGYFDVCAARGLTGNQGVLIPASNCRHLMLRHDVVEAVAAGRFSIQAVETVDDAMTLLSGLPAGERDARGAWPKDSVNGRVAARLAAMADQAREFATNVRSETARSRTGRSRA